MADPRKKRLQRQKRPTPYRGEEHHFTKMWRDPETREQLLVQVRKAAKIAGRPPGVPDGYTNKLIETVIRPQAEAEAEAIMKRMEDEGILEPVVVVEDELLSSNDMMAREALKTAIVIMRTPGAVQHRLASARTVLEYTKAKPESSVKTTVAAAEDFLAVLASKV